MSLNGIDTASYQAGLNPAKVPCDFVIVKATQGTRYVNPDFKRMADAVLKAGKLLGIYHYAEGGNQIKEADHFLKIIGPYIGKATLWLDWEGKQNSSFGKIDTSWCKVFLPYIKKQTGVTCGIYMSKTVCRRHDWSELSKYPLWCAQYASNSITGYQAVPWTDNDGFGAWKKPVIYQYSSHGRLSGWSKDLDLDIAYMSKEVWSAMAQPVKNKISRQDIVDRITSWEGWSEKNGKFKKIIDIYNDYLPTAILTGTVNYKVKYTDEWCATAASAAYIQAGVPELFPIECSCPRMVTLAKKMGIWKESDSYTPALAESVLYDWQDTGSGDNIGTPDHIGIVISVNKSAGTFTVMEGNKDETVGSRTMKINGKYIRGFICPKFTSEKTAIPFTDKTDTELGIEIWAGKHGSGDARREALGIRYGAAQSEAERLNSVHISEYMKEIKAYEKKHGALFK